MKTGQFIEKSLKQSKQLRLIIVFWDGRRAVC
jgi:hypothetical protein